MPKRTPLFDAHVQLGGKLIEFGGWEMPVHYTSITDEHLAVRRAAGLFDISHMGEVQVRGHGAEEFLNATLVNDVLKLAPGQGQYTLMCNEGGGVIDDLYAYRLTAAEYLLVVNASRIEDDFAWLERQAAAFGGRAVSLRNASAELGAVALQGPKAREIMRRCFGYPTLGTPGRSVMDLKKNDIGLWRGMPAAKRADVCLWIGCTGYTGEDGFEIIASAADIGVVWDTLLAAGAGLGLKPAGLGARDTLRTEACYPLYGHELDERTTPIEAGLGCFVALNKGEFVGRAALVEQKAQGTTKKCVAFKMTDRSPPPRPPYPIWSSGPDGRRIGVVTSGTQSPSLGVGIGLGYVAPEFTSPGTPIRIEIRGKQAPAVTVPKPIYRKPG